MPLGRIGTVRVGGDADTSKGETMKQFAKAFAALSALVLLVVGTELGQDSSWYAYAVSALAVVAVFVVPNTDA